MGMTHSFAAHIITADGVALGDPEIIIMTQADETGAAEEIERFGLGNAESLRGLDELIPDYGWRAVGEPTYVESGYVIVDVERV